jgi:Ca-activated chloride channel family protein
MMLISTAVFAQGLMIVVDRPVPLPRPIPSPRPVPSASYAIKELHIQARILDQAASVQVSQTFVNTGQVAMEVQFLFPLPYDGAIDQLTLLIDGKEYPAQLLPAKEARARYEAIVRANRDPALLEWMGHGLFQTSVFPLPPGAERKVMLQYHQLLRRDHGLTDFVFPLSTAKYTAKPVERVGVRVAIESSADIKNVYSPTHPLEIQRSDARRAVVQWTGTHEIPSSDFRLLYDIGRVGLAARVLSYKPTDKDDGYFLLLASPPLAAADDERPKKTILFVVDKSGSMSGKKIEQAKSALKFVLNNLREGDLFNIVAYDSTVEAFRPELEKFTEDTRKAALGYVEGLYAGGGTNIHDALLTALNQLKDTSRPNYVIFLTDGLPTVGERNEAKIAAAAKSSNTVRARLLPLGVGYDVNSRLLDRLARENFGLSEYVRPDEDIETHVSKVYNRIGSPVMTDVVVRWEFDAPRVEEGTPINRVYPRQVVDLFEGEQLVLVGRYKKSGAAKVVIEGQIGGRPQRFEFPAEFAASSPQATYGFVEKLWATRRIGEIIDELDLHGKNDELVKELVDLSLKHGILTPYTSFLADESARPRELASADRYSQTFRRLERLKEAEGRAGVAQRASKLDLQNATTAPLAAASFAGAAIREIDSDALVVQRGVRSAGNKAFYVRRNVPSANTDKLVVTPETAALDPEKDRDQITVIERFSDAYFALIRDNTPEENQLLAAQQVDEEFLVQLRGRNYLIK